MGILLILFVVVIVLLVRKISEHRKLQSEYLKVAEELNKVGNADEYAARKRNDADKYEINKKIDADKYYEKVKNDTKQLEIRKKELEKELKSLELQTFLGMINIDAYENLKSDEVKNQLSVLRSKQDELVKGSRVIEIDSNISDKKRVADSQKKQILRCFNAECSNIIGNVTVKNVDSSRAKIQRAFDAINKIFAVDGVKLSREYLQSKFEELSLVYAYMVKEDEEREQRKAIREQMVEEEKVRREIEREKQKIEKEQSQFTNEINKLMGYMQKSSDDVQSKLYAEKIKELEDKIKALESEKENVFQREQNTRAGFVYIISNIGAFGDRVFKIGMTRRLEPMDRIAELSSASVPFPFDVHALIFSDDAPKLESILHQHFNKQRVNMVNPRKEFFRVDLEEIKKIVLENHNATVKFVDIPEATEYRETLKMIGNAD